ncbi:MAG TPA: hypothetical protein VJ853_03995, partial [Thermoanaerobaculia bacterium]|nr:hypothetical protein [Thermoanaerobaculia bacterium]
SNLQPKKPPQQKPVSQEPKKPPVASVIPTGEASRAAVSSVILSRPSAALRAGFDGEGSQDAKLEILRSAQDDTAVQEH